MTEYKISTKWFMTGFISCSLYFIYYLNLNYDHILINISKIIILVIPFVIVKNKSLILFLEIKYLVLLYIYMFVSFIFGVLLEQGEFKDYFFLNTFLSLSYLLFTSGRSVLIRDSLFYGIVVALFIGGVIDVFAYYYDFSIWDEKSFVGGLGNPSSFGLFCNISIAWLLFSNYSIIKIDFKLRFLFVFFLSLFSVFSFSLFALLNLVIIYLGYFYFSSFKVRLNMISISVFVFLFLYLMLDVISINLDDLLRFIEHKIMGVGNFLGLVDYKVNAGSVSVRIHIHEQAAFYFNKYWLSMIFGHPNKISYFINDSQFLTYSLSFGFPVLILFLILNFWFIYLALLSKEKFYLLFFISFLLIFLTNRILDYFPVALIYFTVISSMISENNKG